MPILLRDPDGPYFSPGDERAFMEWARQIPCVKQLEGSKSELRLHVKGRRISDACLRELIALFYRYGVAMGQLAQFESSANRSWFRDPSAFWHKPVFGRSSNKPPQSTSASPLPAERTLSIHDSLLTGYVVDGTQRTITLHTEPHRGGGQAFIDVTFRGVVAYDFNGDCFQNIIFSIDEVPVESIARDGEMFVERFRQNAWPRDWNPTVETIEQFFDRVGAKVFELHSSYGIGGWIAASVMEQIVIRPPARKGRQPRVAVSE